MVGNIFRAVADVGRSANHNVDLLCKEINFTTTATSTTTTTAKFNCS